MTSVTFSKNDLTPKLTNKKRYDGELGHLRGRVYWEVSGKGS